jgi:hypothetical protein
MRLIPQKEAMKGAEVDRLHGRWATFRYPWYGYPELPGYREHSGQEVMILRQLRDDECDPECQPHFYFVAMDGWIGNAHRSELTLHKP